MSDHSCYVTIVNHSKVDMTQQAPPVAKAGEFEELPPKIIKSGETVHFKMISDELMGSQGRIMYNVTSNKKNGLLRMIFGCPIFLLNAGDATWSPHPPLGFSIQMTPNPLPKFGSPVHIEFRLNQVDV